MKQRLDKLIISKLSKILPQETAKEIVGNYTGLKINLPYVGNYCYANNLTKWAGVYWKSISVEELGYAESYNKNMFSIYNIDKGYNSNAKFYFMDTQPLTLERMQQIACKKWKLTPIEILKLELL